MFTKTLSTILLIASTLFPGVAMAQDRPIKLESEVQLLRPAAEGEEPKLVEPTGVVPGDTLVFTTSYRNESGSPVTGFTIVNPVSSDLLLSDEAATQTEVSVDGGKTWGQLADLSVIDSEGEENPAGAGDVTHMRWVISEVPPASAGKVQFSATVR